ncbi:MIP/aquaporin family protein [Weissella sagaensis]|jgi:aquaporin Z|uniref:MIP/aquaporin family protein n=1 Tax=Weissella sagaensis TaxID=2559928 RepID=A0ABW1RV07_9LACO|nr:MIP/aquaporin family protein [Weissella sagaensis]MBU7567545.1 aquaporin family protein [Weissella hellenica]
MESNMRKYLAEFFGTLMLVAVGTGTVVLVGLQTGPLPVALAFGIALAAGAYAFGPISGGHFNPAVSLGAAINGRITWGEFVGYVISQLIGSLAGSALVWAIMQSVGANATMIKQVGFGQTDYTAPVSFIGASVIEMILTFLFVLVILMVTSKKASASSVAAPMIIGLTLAALITVGVSVTGASLNPARSFGPAIFFAMFGSATALTHIAAYFIGPLVGGALAALVAKYGLGSEE